MLRKVLFSLTMVASLASTNALAADPSMHQVYQAAEAGNFQAAQSMMDQVLRDHPNSAKAHFVEAELLAKQGNISNAQTELATAERLEPGLPFAKPGAVEKLKARLSSTSGANYGGISHSRAAGSSFPWGLVFLLTGLIAFVFVVVRMMSRRTAYQVQPAGTYGGSTGTMPYGYGGMGPVPGAGGLGSGILGGLATGAAVGAGMVAGEELMHHMLDGNQSGNVPVRDDSWDSLSQSQYDMGGNDFGVSDASSWDDGSSMGGDDWS